ncbi:MAG TPA: molybdopterin-dependent oxidoreductase [Acidobacteriota bacterium]|nr:molybdopterin-dependent oxidoreductase [Acidobacteriota bacterium]
MLFDQDLEKRRKKAGRRRFLALAVTAAGGWWAYRWWRQRPQELKQRVVRYLTPIKDFYKVSIYLGYRPEVDLETWKLAFGGDSETAFELTYQDLMALPSRRLPKTFMCIENPVGGAAVGNAEWTAAALAPLLERLLGTTAAGGPGLNRTSAEQARDDSAAGETEAAVLSTASGQAPSPSPVGKGQPAADMDHLRVVFRARDGFFSSVPLEVGLDPEAYLAYEMNGRRLPREHGFPARVLLPGKYGMKQPKWLERIEITSRNVGGYWENQGWSDSCDVRMMSRIDRVDRLGREDERPSRPGDRGHGEHFFSQQQDAIPQETTTAETSAAAGDTRGSGIWVVEGIAYCGGQAVGAVEISCDGQDTWHEAELTSSRRPNAWTTWRWLWKPSARGSYTLAVRTRDASGKRQPESYTGSFPSGSTGIHKVSVEV